jgi:Ca-activated chloride channel family protein
VSIDEETLREIADRTGGAYFRATDSGSLEEIYGQIDELERTSVEQRRYMEFGEAAVESLRVRGVTIPPLLAVVFVLLAAETLLSTTIFRRIP